MVNCPNSSGTRVFVIPKEAFKSERDYVVILNDVAWSIIQARRGEHAQYVVTYLGHQEEAVRGPVDTINNTAWQKARARVGLKTVRVHDLRHTFGQRLRQAGVASEDRALLLGHAVTDMTGHYATATVARLIELANLANGTRDTVTLLRVAAAR